MKKVLKLMVIKLVFLAIVIGVIRVTPIWNSLLSAGKYQKVDFASLVLTKKPNQFLICPQDYCPSAKAHKISPVFQVPAIKLSEAFDQVIKAQKSISDMVRIDQSTDFVVRTPLIGWPDRVTVQIIPISESESTLAIYSRSVYGRSDFSVNEKRIAQWLEELEKQLAA
ncbi:MAG: DUF1499 domain-containing protein [Alphaproteobacteria bacterium]|nr:DUF1499 domain-containing protein [Rhodospirillales bacterium]MCW9044977.1 DUF1499 domain-containing protein [Alphaproteobacteria bacterium]